MSQGSAAESPSPPEVEENFVAEDAEEEEYYEQQMSVAQPAQTQGYSGSPIGKSPWNTPKEWRGGNTAGGANNGANNGNGASATMDDVQRALSALELSASGASSRGTPQLVQGNNASGAAQPPRFTNQASAGMRAPIPVGSGLRTSADLRLVTEFNAQMAASSLYQSTQVQQNVGGQGFQGPFSAAAYVPPIGHGAPGQSGSKGPMGNTGRGGQIGNEQGQAGQTQERAATASGVMWDQKDRVLGSRSSNPNLQYQQQQGGQGWNNSGGPPVPTIPAQYLQQQQQQQQQQAALRLGSVANYGGALGPETNNNASQPSINPGAPGYVGSPVDVPTLIATKGYNPTNFEIRPTFARYFVIKSYTEDDVHKSLKYEIWSSTDPGNKRLDKAFKECAGRGPIYLFFSVNARYSLKTYCPRAVANKSTAAIFVGWPKC